MSGRDDMAADILADVDYVDCADCCGTGIDRDDFDGDSPCLYCEGTGQWPGPP